MTLFPFGETLQLLPYVGTADDGMGNETPSWGDAVTITHCGFDPGGTSEPRNGLSQRVIALPRLFVPYGLPIAPQDRILRGSETYEVEGFPADWTQPQTGWDPGALVVNLKRIEG